MPRKGKDKAVSEVEAAQLVTWRYDERQVEIITDRGIVRAVAYIATAKDPSRRPYHWYKAFVVEGAREHALPQEYLQSLENAPSVPDPIPARAAENERLLTTS